MNKCHVVFPLEGLFAHAISLSLSVYFSAMATSNCCSYVSSSSLLRHRSSSVANVTQFSFLYPPYGGRLLAERFGLATLVVSRQNLAVSPPSAAVEARISGKREPMTPPYNVLITGSTKGSFTLSSSIDSTQKRGKNIFLSYGNSLN